MSSRWLMSSACRFAGAFFVVSIALLSSPGSAQRAGAVASSPFDGLPGNWSGSGTITLSNGSKERIRCRAEYGAPAGQGTLRMALRCASDSYKFDLRSNVTFAGGGISGQWTEATRNAAGNVTGSARGEHIEALVDSPGFSARVLVTTRGDRQSVTINGRGQEAAQVAITLNRGSS